MCATHRRRRAYLMHRGRWKAKESNVVNMKIASVKKRTPASQRERLREHKKVETMIIISTVRR